MSARSHPADHPAVESAKGDVVMEFLFYSVGSLLGVYVLSRLIFAAYFRAKQQYEDKRYGQRTKQESGTR
jgi:hypothetical protein